MIMYHYFLLIVLNLIIFFNCSTALSVKKSLAEPPTESAAEFDIGLSEAEQQQIGILFWNV